MTERTNLDLRRARSLRLTAAVLGLCLALVGISGCRKTEAIPHVLLVRPNAESVEERGICSVDVGDGAVLLTETSGVPCIANMSSNDSPTSRYCYFHVLDDSLHACKAVYAVVRYYDAAKQSVIELEYDASGNAYRNAVLMSGGRYSGTHRWRSAVFRMDTPGFAGEENGGADLRLHGKHLCINLLAVSPDLKRALAALTPTRDPR